MSIHRVDEAMVRKGQITVSNLPLADGELVQVIITDLPVESPRTITEVRQLLRGAVERYDDPFGPAIPIDSWEMLK